jgi:hypothetical protein
LPKIIKRTFATLFLAIGGIIYHSVYAKLIISLVCLPPFIGSTQKSFDGSVWGENTIVIKSWNKMAGTSFMVEVLFIDFN